LSVRNTQHESPPLKEEYKAEYEQSKQRKRLRIVNDAPAGEFATPLALNKELDRLFAALNVTEYMVQ
jgi:hypothetical protein